MELVPAGFILDRCPARPCPPGERGRPSSRARPPERGCDWGRRLKRGTAGLGRVRLERGATGGSERESTLATARRFILSLIHTVSMDPYQPYNLMGLRVLEKCPSSSCVSISQYLSTETQPLTKISYQNKHTAVGWKTSVRSRCDSCIRRSIDEWHWGTGCLTLLLIVCMRVLYYKFLAGVPFFLECLLLCLLVIVFTVYAF